MWSIFAYFGVIVVSHRMWLRCVFALVWGFVGGFFLSNWPNQSQLFLNFYAHEFPDQDTVDRLDVRLPECGLVWTEDTSRRASEKLSFFFHPRWLKFLCGYFFFFFASQSGAWFFFFFCEIYGGKRALRFPLQKSPSQPRTCCSFNSSLTYLSFPPEHSSTGRAERWDRSTSQIGVPSLFLKPPGEKVSFHSNGERYSALWKLREKTMEKKMEMCRFFSLSLG